MDLPETPGVQIQQITKIHFKTQMCYKLKCDKMPLQFLKFRQHSGMSDIVSSLIIVSKFNALFCLLPVFGKDIGIYCGDVAYVHCTHCKCSAYIHLHYDFLLKLGRYCKTLPSNLPKADCSIFTLSSSRSVTINSTSINLQLRTETQPIT